MAQEAGCRGRRITAQGENNTMTTTKWRQSLAVFSLALSAPLWVDAAPEAPLATQKKIWRCGNAYTDRPCASGTLIEADDPRSSADRQAADAATRSIQAQADALARERQRMEAAQAHRGPIVMGRREPNTAAAAGVAPHGPLKNAKPQKEKGLEHFKARGPAPEADPTGEAPKKKKKPRKKKKEAAGA
jgi:hypothetical protein